MSYNFKLFITLLLLVLISVTGYLAYFNLNYKTPDVYTSESERRFNGAAGGCGNILVFKTNKNNNEGIVIMADKSKLNFSDNQTKEYKLEDVVGGLSVRYVTGKNVSHHYCNDALDPEDFTMPLKESTATQGVVNIKTFRREYSSKVYEVSINLANIKFQDKEVSLLVDKLFIDTVQVGWMPG